MITMEGPIGPSLEPFTLTLAQYEALQALPPGVYLVCSRCRKMYPQPEQIVFNGDDAYCRWCA